VVHDEGEDVVVVGEADQVGAQEWAGGEVEGLGGVVGDQAVGVLRVPCRPDGQVYFGWWVDGLDGLAGGGGGEGGAEGLVAGGDFGEGCV
jgi:hypothetical protein